MITAETLRHCAYLNSLTLESLIRKNYPEDRVLTSEFIGITNGRQFCYKIGYQDPDLKGQGLTYSKVFVWQDDNGKLVAEY